MKLKVDNGRKAGKCIIIWKLNPLLIKSGVKTQKRGKTALWYDWKQKHNIPKPTDAIKREFKNL